MANSSIEYHDLNYMVVLRDYMLYLQRVGCNTTADDVKTSADFKRILASMNGRIINNVPGVTCGQSLSRYYKNKIEREMEQMEEVAEADALRLREEPEPVIEER